MTAPAFGNPNPLIQRDGYGRPKIITPDGKTVAYTRCTTYVKALDDLNNLLKWKARMTLLGAAKSPAILKSAKAHTADDKRPLDELVEKACELAGAGDKATEGTTLHKLTERMDAGEDLTALNLDPATIADLDAYRAGTTGLTFLKREAFVVHDELRVAGTFDHLAQVNTGSAFPAYLHGKRVIADLKTGSLDWSIGAIAMQLAMYAHSDLYDPETQARTKHEADLTTGVIIHLPLGQARCDLYLVNLSAGWDAVQLAGQVRAWRTAAKLPKLTMQVAS